MKSGAVVFAVAFAAAALIAKAEDILPPGLVRSGGVIMMQPIGDSDLPAGASANERHAGTIRVLTPSDRDLYERAFAAADRGDWTAALTLAGQGHEAAARKLLEWRRLLDKNSGATFAEIVAFLRSNPDWPLRDSLFARAEAAIDPMMSPSAIVAWFGDRPPASALGRIRLGEALIATGAVTRGRDDIARGWREGDFDPPQELAIVQKDATYLSVADDRARLDNLLWREDFTAAQRELARVDDATARIGAARIALIDDPTHAQKLIDGLPAAARSDPGLVFDWARKAHREGNDSRAESLILSIASREPARAHPSKWSSLFNLEARQALQDHNYRTAYQIADVAGLPRGEEYFEAEFLAGWIALRYLKEPQEGLMHFEQLDAAVTRPISKARAAYWEGRADEAMGKDADARRSYELASKEPETFYGQIALARLDGRPLLHVPDVAIEPIPKEAFEKETLTRPMEVLADLGEQSLLRAFAMRDLELDSTAPHAHAMMRALTDWGFKEIALRIAKSKSYDGVLMLSYSHPTIDIPTYAGPPPAPEPALVLGLIRQETEFDPAAISGPGARGLMQLMPESARKAANEAHLAYRPEALLTDTAYNMQLGMTEVSSDLTQWGGSYILAIASYNAGVHNADKWVVAYGDPRNPAVDPIDWIESIPFSETRNYVERVIENTEIYRNRLARRDTPLQIMADLYAPNTPPINPLNAQAARAEPSPTDGSSSASPDGATLPVSVRR